MPTLLQINVTSNWGSHGKIAENIGRLAMDRGWKSVIAYGRHSNPSKNETIQIGSTFSVNEHVLENRLFDNHGLASRIATNQFTQRIDQLKPNLVHLHNIHGYYLNYKRLFEYLAETNVPVVWTFHDCWPFTGHCAYFDYVGCDRWKTECKAPCPCKGDYPKSLLFEATNRNYNLKKESFNSLKNLTIVPVSEWLGRLLSESFLKDYPVYVIKNGIDINTFKPISSEIVREKYGIGQHPYVIGVASVWDRRKGFDDFVKLRKLLSGNVSIVLVGLDEKKLATAQKNGIVGIPRTENVSELVALYSDAIAFLNLTYEDNYPTTNLEAMSCGTPVLTYRTGGSPEAVTDETGWVIEKGDIESVLEITRCLRERVDVMRDACRKRAEEHFDKNKCFQKYVDLYESLMQK